MSDACQVGCGRVFRGAESMEKCERHEKTCDGTPKALAKSPARSPARVVQVDKCGHCLERPAAIRITATDMNGVLLDAQVACKACATKAGFEVGK